MQGQIQMILRISQVLYSILPDCASDGPGYNSSTAAKLAQWSSAMSRYLYQKVYS